MIKAEVIIEHEGVTVPNWVALCRDVLTSAPTIGTVTVLILAFLGFGAWQNHKAQQPVLSSTDVQSIPAATSELKVVSPSSAMNAPAAENSLQTAGVTGAGASSISPAANNTTPVGPAPRTSLNSLQPSSTSQQPGSITQAVGQTVQSAGNSLNNAMNNLGL